MIDIPTDTPHESATTSGNARQSKFFVDVIKIMSGTTVAQIISVLASPVLSRLFNPDAFGVFALFSSIVGILAAIFTLEYELAIMLPKDDSDAANLVAGSLGIGTLFSFLTIPVVWLGGPTIVRWLHAPDLAPFLWFLPVLLFFGGIGSGHPVLNAWASRTRHFAQISATQVASTLTSTLAKVGAGFAGFNSGGGLIGGGLVGAILSPSLLGLGIWKQNKNLFLESVRLPKIVEILRRYRKFAIYNTPSALLNTASWQVPSFLLASFFSPTIVGYYAFGNQILRVPMSLIGGSIGQAFYSHAATAYHEGTLTDLVESTFRRLVTYSFPPMLMLALIGKELCNVIFGSQWVEAGVYIQILSVWTLVWFVTSPMSRLFSVLEKNEFSFWMNLIMLIGRILAIWLGGILGSPRLALVFFAIVGMSITSYVSVNIIMAAGVPMRRIAQILMQNSLIFAPMAGLILILKYFHVRDWLQLLTAALIVGSYYAYSFKNEIPWRSLSQQLLQQVKRNK